MYSEMCEAEWYAKYGYDTLDIEVCTGLERSFDAGCEYFMNWAILDSCSANTYVESTCEGEDCGIPGVVKIILWSFVVLLVAGVVYGIISATGSSSLPLLDSELTSLFMENSFADKITFDF